MPRNTRNLHERAFCSYIDSVTSCFLHNCLLTAHPQSGSLLLTCTAMILFAVTLTIAKRAIMGGIAKTYVMRVPANKCR
jgi:hypothetical protein